jgi:peptidoglycan/LPS O-acetylase OafA/YrhL
MIQRIQTLYLIGAAIATGILPFFMPLWIDSNSFPQYFSSKLSISILFGFSTALSVLSIFSYKKRQQQFVIGRLNIILNLILIGLFVFNSITLSGDNQLSEKGIGLILPFVSIVLLVLANKAIQKDEKLVKSSNRLR